MGHKKLVKFEAIKTFKNVLQHPLDMPNNWSTHFGNDNPITLELACGKGEYTVGLARLNPNRNFIGIDIKGNRIYRGAKTALDEGLTNVAFLRIEIEKITEYFGKDEVAEIWITFPDPQLQLSRAKKRLTHPRFLRSYQNLLRKDGVIHLKTDSPNLYEFTKLVIKIFQLPCLVDYDDVYAEINLKQELQIKTYYESLDIAKSNRIHYLQFLVNKNLDNELDNTLKNTLSEISVSPR